jgi:hypothetical protein
LQGTSLAGGGNAMKTETKHGVVSAPPTMPAAPSLH